MLKNRVLDKNSPIPLYFQLKQVLLAEISSGEYPPDSMLPTENELVEMFGISRTTVRQAVMDLVREGKLYRIKSKGTFIAQPKIMQSLTHKFRSLADEISDAGGAPRVEVNALEVVDMPEHLSGLRGEKGKKAIYLSRTHYNGDIAVVHTETYYPYEGYEFLLEQDFTKERLYQVLSRYPDKRVERISRDIEAATASSMDVRNLGVRRGSPIHCFKNIGYNQKGEVVEISFAHYRGDRNTFHIDIILTEEYDK